MSTDRFRWITLVLPWLAVLLIFVSVAARPAPQTAKAAAEQPPSKTRSPHGPLAINCQDCHTFSAWKPIRQNPEFNHNKTKYPLRGMHATVACTQCHLKPVFSNVGHKCSDCHADLHRGKMGSQCESCHTVKGWKTSLAEMKNHQNRFPLLGAHATTDCESCHTNGAAGNFQGLPTQCVGCHITKYLNTKSPNHQAMGFPTTCQQCHTSFDSWQGAKFDHLQATGFALVGAHANLDCASCHAGGKFQGTPSTCIGCHQQDFNGAKSPDHVGGSFPTTCSTCHTMTSWAGAKFDHAAMTGFALTGTHSTLQCVQCHVGGRYKGTPSDCASCHMTDFTGAKNPDHVAGGFPQTCASCHNTSTWSGATFDHASTGFALTGAHRLATCTQCHINGQYKGTSPNCSSCHMPDFTGAKNPDHVAMGFPQSCDQCHSTTSWSGATFNHNTQTSFALTGAHTSLACTQCHVNGVFAGTPKTCSSCHMLEFTKTTDPNHLSAGFPTDCSVCHSTVNWLGAVFDHSKTLFPLTGAHVAVTCANCHASGKFAGLSTACSSCHLAKFNATTNPNHVTGGFPQTCEICHTTTAWTPSTFNHANTNFPLTGAHVNVACASCHVGGRYAGTPTDCYSCHKADYTSVSNPNHVAAGFPTTCTTCHTTTTWAGAVFNHTWFPIYSGSHAGKWTTCADCHTNPSDYSVFSCTTCHAHAKATMDSAHQGVRNYVYNSPNCYACHPQGRAG